MVDRLRINRLAEPLRWAARVVGTLLLAMVLGVFVGNVLNGTTLENIGELDAVRWTLVAAVAAMLAGCAIAWRWETVGGAMTFGSGLVFILISSALTRSVRAGPVEAGLVVVGALFVLCRWLDPISPDG